MSPSPAATKRRPAPSAPPAPHAPPEPALPPDPLAAAAVLLPALDAEAASGHLPSAQAATLIRTLLSQPPPRPSFTATEALPEAAHRLSTLVRAQDQQLARLHAMLDALL